MLSISTRIYSQLTISDSNVVVIGFTGFTASGFSPYPDPGQLDSDTWSVMGLSDGDLGFGDYLATGDFARGISDGGVSTGGIFAFETDSGNIALGIQPTSGDWSPGSFILKIQNKSGIEIIELDLTYSILVYNDQGRSGSFNLLHSRDNITYTPENELDYLSPEAADVTPEWIETARNISLDSINIEDSGYYYLKWEGDDVSGIGSRDEFALDNIRIKPIYGEKDLPHQDLLLIYPEGGETLYIGDSLRITWVSQGVDSIYIKTHLPLLNGFGYFECSCLVDASTGEYILEMTPGNIHDSLRIILTDFPYEQIPDTSGWIHLVDTISAGPVLSSRNDIVSFILPVQTGNAEIDCVNHTVNIEVATGTDLTCLVPEITPSEKAIISPASGEIQDFSDPMIYTVTAEDGTSQVWTVIVTVKTISLTIQLNDSGIKVFPNPNDGKFCVVLFSEQGRNYALSILDINGKLVYTGRFESLDDLNKQVNLEGLGKGVYIIRIISGSFIWTDKLILQ
ncbi:MAG: hypothetical protein AMS27_05275 [Bacteroides sp. SM23_62_1]|nr:MAG: hypothetical protein AMS27_05275 [Bacteroides sp. SM23_62_1]